jgi:hypothetical protein
MAQRPRDRKPESPAVKAPVLSSRIPVEIRRELLELHRLTLTVFAGEPVPPGTTTEGLTLSPGALAPIVAGAAKRASGVRAAARRTEVVWADGADELVVDPGGVSVETTTGAVVVSVPVACDQSGPATVRVTFAVGSPDRPAGLIAAATRVPEGPIVVVSRWGDALVAFAWSVLLGMVNGVAAATGVDRTGARLVAGEVVATRDGLTIVPLARHRFGGATR